MLAAGDGEDGAGAPSGWRRAREGERERRAARVGNLPTPSGKPETIDMFLPDQTKSLHEYL
jgi:hypothetical protein